MLVLSRKVGERVVIDGKVTVVVTRVVGNRVTLGIEAPADVHVLRGELQDSTRDGGNKARELADQALATGSASPPSGATGAGTVPEAARPAPLAAMTAAVLASHAASGSITTSP